MVAFSACGQETLIGPSTRNGSFEDGVNLPWGGVSIVTQNAVFASDGQWFATLSAAGSGTARTDSFQSVVANPGNGRIFILSFAARNGTSGFDSVSAFINTQNSDGSSVLPTVTTLMSPLLVNSTWGTYQKQFAFPNTWDGSSVRLGIDFLKNGAINGTTYTGYLDNISLQQIPEPSSLALCLTSGILAAHRFLWRRAREFPRVLAPASSVT